MKVIVAGSRGLSNYGRLCRVLEPERRRIACVLSGGARGADQLASCGPGGMACLSSSFRRSGTCLASRRASCATGKWLRRVTSSSRSMTGSRVAQRT